MLFHTSHRSKSIVSAAFLSTTFIHTDFSLSQTSNNSSPIDWILIVDTSASMVGEGGTKNIFGRVKETVTEFINKAKVGDSITLFTFDSNTILRNSLKISTNLDRESSKQIVQNLEATGQNTHIGKALQDALNYTIQIEKRPDGTNRTVSVVLFTDGIEDTVGIQNPVSIPSNLTLINNLNRKPYVFLVSLGEGVHESQLDQFANNPALNGRGSVLRSPGANNLLQAGERIRDAAAAITPPPPKIIAEPQPIQTSINFGEVASGEETLPQNFQVRNNVPVKIAIQLESAGSKDISLIEPNAPIAAAANVNTDIPIRLKINNTAIAGSRELKFTLIPEVNQPNTEPRNASVIGTVTISPRLSLSTQTLDFDKVERGQTTLPKNITIQSNGEFTIKPIIASTSSSEISVPENLRSLAISPNKPIEVPIQLNLAESLKTGLNEVEIKFVESQSDKPLAIIKARVEVLDPLWLRLLPIVLSVLFFLLLLGWIWTILNAPNNLEGELEIEDHESIDLARLRTKKLDLSKELASRLGDDKILEEVKAELRTVKQDRKTQIMLYPHKGNVEINGLGIASQETIYDDDILTIGTIKATFKAIDHPRPTISEES